MLFVPVSGGHGSGEAQRCLMLARRLRQRHGGGVRIRVLLSRDTPFPRDAFETVDLPGSPTRSETEVVAAIAAFSPHLCVFDSSLRMSALRAARAAGSRTAYISVRPNSRWRGFDPRKRSLLDEHWLIAPERLDGPAPWPERLAALVLRQTRFRRFSAVAEPADPAAAQGLLESLAVPAGAYALACLGGAGYRVDGMTAPAFLAAVGQALPPMLAPAMTVLAIDAAGAALPAGWIALPRVPNATLMALVAGARLAVVNGGGLLVQALAQGAACLALPMQEEQAGRIAAFEARGAVIGCAPQRQAVARAWADAWSDEARLDTLRRQARTLPLRNDLDAIVACIAELSGAARVP